MNIPTKKLKNGFELPVLGLGTWRIAGSKDEADYSQDDNVLEAINRGMDAGLTHIDTAEIYGAGHAEVLLGQVLATRNRSDFFIASKVWPDNARRDDVLRAAERSLHRLQTDYLDLYMLHWPSDTVPIEETMGALNEMVEQGLVRNIGLSNFDPEQLASAQKVSDRPIVANQVKYNLFSREAVRSGLVKYAQKNDILINAWSPLEGIDEPPPLLGEIAHKHEASPARIALAWLLQQPNVVTIIRASSQKHLDDNLASLKLELSSKDLARLTEELA